MKKVTAKLLKRFEVREQQQAEADKILAMETCIPGPLKALATRLGWDGIQFLDVFFSGLERKLDKDLDEARKALGKAECDAREYRAIARSIYYLQDAGSDKAKTLADKMLYELGFH